MPSDVVLLFRCPFVFGFSVTVRRNIDIRVVHQSLTSFVGALRTRMFASVLGSEACLITFFVVREMALGFVELRVRV